MCIYVHIMYMCVCMYIYIYIYTCICCYVLPRHPSTTGKATRISRERGWTALILQYYSIGTYMKS